MAFVSVACGGIRGVPSLVYYIVYIDTDQYCIQGHIRPRFIFALFVKGRI